MTSIDLDSLLADLTEPQRDAVRHVDGPLLVIAGPGSGKTRVITRRIAFLVAQGIPSWEILALTFTNKAAGEMRERVEAIVPADLTPRYGMNVTTFHSLCARLLRRYGEAVGVPPAFSIYDAADQRAALKDALRGAGLSDRNWTPASVGAAISHAKNQLIDVEAYERDAADFYSRSIAKAYRAYEKVLAANGALDFDDLLLRTARVLRDDQGVREELQERFQYLLIDEYQDTNHVQFVIAHTLVRGHGNICVVGDPDQSIYGWRGADIRNILDFESHYPATRIITLGENFRSTGHIVAVADGLIANNAGRPPKRLFSNLGDGEQPAVVRAGDEHHEARLVVDELRRRREAGIPWKEMAVLYRINALSRVLEDTLRAATIPYIIARGTAFYERREVKDALSYLRLVANPLNDIALKRIVNTPPRGIGKTSLDKLELHAINRQLPLLEAMRDARSVGGLSARAVAAVGRFTALVDGWRSAPAARLPHDRADAAALADLVERIIRESGLEAAYASSRSEEDHERAENLSELVSAAADFEPAGDALADETALPPTRLAAFLDSVALVSDADVIDPTSGVVTLLTLHAAKGLEYEVIVLVGCEEGLLPHSRSFTDESELEEERRLCYVGITRARRHLMLSSARSRTHRGRRERSMASRFLRELPEEAVITLDLGGFEYDEDAQDAYDDRFADIRVGVIVEHPLFGIGRVVGRRPDARYPRARVEFEEAGTKTLVLDRVRLRVIDEQ